MATRVPYTSVGVCYVQINRNDCDGFPLTVADGDGNVIILGTAGDATELELSQQYETQAAQSDGPCWFSPASKTKSGAQATLRWCSTTMVDNILLHGQWLPMYDTAGNICGWAGPKVGASECCKCNGTDCVSNGFSIISVSCPQDCNGKQIKDEDGNPLWEYTIITQVDDVTEVQNRRRSSTPSNNRVDYQYELVSNDNYGFGPADAFIADGVYQENGLDAVCTDVMVFLSPQAPPTVGCPCDEDAYVGQFVTAAAIAAGLAPAPIGG